MKCGKMNQMNRLWQGSCLWLRQISSLYRRYISGLILLANGIETKPSPAVADYIDSSKTVCAPNSSSNIPSGLSNRQIFYKTVSDC